MKQVTNEDIFITVIGRINIYLVALGVILLVYFLLKTKVDVFLFLLAIFNMLFALLSYKHLMITNRLAIELERAKGALGDVSKEMREIHPDLER